MTKMITQIETPFSAPTERGLVRNVYYSMLAVRDSLERGEVPYASHLFYTQMLNDNTEHERQLGIDAGLEIGKLAVQTVVYIDLGISPGMEYGILAADDAGRPVHRRRLFAKELSDEEIEELIFEQAKLAELPSVQAISATYGRILKTKDGVDEN